MRALEGPHSVDSNDLMAEREGFEPPVALRLRLISSQVHSTGLCHLSALLSITYDCNFCASSATCPKSCPASEICVTFCAALVMFLASSRDAFRASTMIPS